MNFFKSNQISCLKNIFSQPLHLIQKNNSTLALTLLQHKQQKTFQICQSSCYSVKSKMLKQHDLPFCHLNVKKFSTSEEPVSEVPSYYDRYIFPQPPDLVSSEEHNTVVEKVNESIAKPEKGRLFAVVYITAKQYKVTDNDLIKAAGRIVGVKTGDRIKLEKVLMVGGEDFTLVGRPFVKRSLVNVEATVVEITTGVEKVVQYFERGESFERRYFITPLYTILRINSIQAFPELS